MENLMSTKEVAAFLNVNEKMVYTLVAEKGLPATKITGKWLFPKHLVERWVEANTSNFPEPTQKLPPYHGLLIVAGSNDLLLDKAISLFNTMNSEQIAVFGNLGSMGGLNALRKNLCHIASSHLLQENDNDYNFAFASRELEAMPAVVNFCSREQGILLQKGNPRQINAIKDLAKPGITIINRSLATGTRLLLDNELREAGIKGEKIKGYQNIVNRHMDVGLEILAGNADAGPGIRPVASLLGLDFIPLRWERFDLLIAKDCFFDQGVQKFQGLLHESAFKKLARSLDGYDIGDAGKMVFPQ
ncbi:MAG: helix-turn-helix transcriptional regulator [Deltaproteobacteria bacterium]|nr:helix-turn-helix transcriptional regulator [Deltaproteobacteria bacterium]MBW2297103.1 helix-turn-helix transcriptional regulator [Deltaproteobacteria bacterium]